MRVGGGTRVRTDPRIDLLMSATGVCKTRFTPRRERRTFDIRGRSGGLHAR